MDFDNVDVSSDGEEGKGESLEERFLLPNYAIDSIEGEKEKEHVSRELGLYEGDGRLFRIFDSICGYARHVNSGKFEFASFFKYLLKRNINQIRGETNLSYYSINLIDKLETAKYCSVSRSDNGDIYSLTLKDPLFETIQQFLDTYYGVNDKYYFPSTLIYENNILPTLDYVANKLHSTEEKVGGLCRDLLEEEFDFFAAKKVFEEGHHLRVRFSKTDLDPFVLIFAKNNNVDVIVTEIMISSIVRFERENSHFQESLKERFLEDKNFSRQDYSDCTKGDKFYNSDLFLRWLQIYIHFINSVEFLENNNKYLSTDTLEKMDLQGDIILTGLRQMAHICYVYLFNMREMEKRQKQKLADLGDDQKKIVYHLVEKAKSFSDVAGTVGGKTMRNASFELAKYDDIASILDGLGKEKLEEKYSHAAIKKLLDIRDKRMSKIYKVSINEEDYYVHRWRILDVFYTENVRESNRINQRIVKAWAKLPKKEVPSKTNFEILKSDLSEIYRSTLELCTNVMEASESDNDLVALFYPSPSEVGIYKLSSSDLTNPERYNQRKGRMEDIRPIERINYVREIIYDKRNLLSQKKLKDILGLDYDKLISDMKSYKKKLKRESSEYKLKGGWEKFLFGLFNGIANFILEFARLFEGGGKKKKKNKRVVGDTSNNPSEYNKRPSLNDVAEKFRVPTSISDLKEEIENSNKRWNNVIIDPKSYYPKWNDMSIPDKDKARKEIKIEEDKRRKDARKKVDTAINKIKNKIDLRDMDDKDLTEISMQLTSKLRKHNREPLANYIKHMLIFLNSD